ncbi:hypothetical protein TNCV_4519451 [Trichonephila clavipes]|nr:hypothetical protein TNCV_4519451 [Trichonephila clavipes]
MGKLVVRNELQNSNCDLRGVSEDLLTCYRVIHKEVYVMVEHRNVENVDFRWLQRPSDLGITLLRPACAEGASSPPCLHFVSMLVMHPRSGRTYRPQ